MSISEIKLYNILRKRLGEQETTELVELVHSEVKSELDTRTSVFLTKEDKIDLISRFEEDKIDLINRIDNAKTDLIDRIYKSKTETVVWIVGIGILQFMLTILSRKML